MERGLTRTLVERFFAALNARDWDGLAGVLHPEVVYEVPQTRERVCGRLGYVDFNRTFPGNWSLEVTRIVADERGAAAEAGFLVDGEAALNLAFFEFRDGLIARVTDFWPEPYEPPRRESGFVERY